MLYPISSNLHTLILVFISGSFGQGTTATFAHWWLHIFPISSTFINWNSSIKKSCPEKKKKERKVVPSPFIYLFNYLYQFELMGIYFIPWVIYHSKPTIDYFDARIVPDLTFGAYILSSCSLHFSTTSLFFGATKLSLIFCF